MNGSARRSGGLFASSELGRGVPVTRMDPRRVADDGLRHRSRGAGGFRDANGSSSPPGRPFASSERRAASRDPIDSPPRLKGHVRRGGAAYRGGMDVDQIEQLPLDERAAAYRQLHDELTAELDRAPEE